MELQRKILTTSMSALAVVAVLGVAPLNVQAQQTTHTVEAGEYLYNIAPQYDVTVDELIEWNNLSSNDLEILFDDGELIFSGVYSALLEQIDNFNYIPNYQRYEKGSDFITIYTDSYVATFNSDDTTGSITYYSSEE